MRPSPPHPETGNALFLILIAVALFAALAYAVTQSGRGGGSIDREQATLLAAQIVQQAAGLQATVQRVLLTGTAVAELDFCSGAGVQCGHNTPAADACSSGADCVFAPEGGGAVAPAIPAAALSGGFASSLRRWIYISGASFSGVGTAAADPVAFACGLTLPVCESINRGLGESATPPAFAALAIGLICAAPIGVTGAADLPAWCPGCVGKAALCVNTGFGWYAYYSFLAER